MINVFANYYYEKNILRRKEIDQCIINNLINKNINYILINSNDRMKYNDFFNIINSYTGSNDINILCNLDIYFDDTVIKVKNIQEFQFYCLSRWEVRGNNIDFSNRPDSQDVWIFKGKCKPINGDFYLGWAGCDNRIAHEAQTAGYQVSNPSIDIKTYHIHNSNLRNYRVGDRSTTVPEPYLTLQPCQLP